MSVSAMVAAKYLASKSGWTLSNLEIQKILYIAQMFHLGRHGAPLIDEPFEAWDYGPVQPKLYHELKMFGRKPVQNIFHGVRDVPTGSDELKTLEEAYESLHKAGPARLIHATHRPGGAWERNYEPGRRNRLIPPEDLVAEFQRL